MFWLKRSIKIKPVWVSSSDNYRADIFSREKISDARRSSDPTTQEDLGVAGSPSLAIWRGLARHVSDLPWHFVRHEENIPVGYQIFRHYIRVLNIQSPLSGERVYPSTQIDIFMNLAIASYKATSTIRCAKCAAEDAWLLNRNRGPVIDQRLWKRMYEGIQVYKGVRNSLTI